VKEAVADARENGREKVIAAFNDPDGPFARNNVYVFATDYSPDFLSKIQSPIIIYPQGSFPWLSVLFSTPLSTPDFVGTTIKNEDYWLDRF
jgi:hypothetical protein